MELYLRQNSPSGFGIQVSNLSIRHHLHLHVPALGKVLLTYGCFCLGDLIHHNPF